VLAGSADGMKPIVRALMRANDELNEEEATVPEPIRAQVIRELRDAASDEGPQSAYWLAADYLERK
jgi:hypothetical protein